MISKPMLAETLEIDNPSQLDALRYPVYATPKLDGIRCLRKDNRTLSRKFLDIPNKYVQAQTANLINGLDGELMVKDANFNTIQSGIMSEDGEPNFEFHVFDYVSSGLSEPYTSRIENLKKLSLPSYCKLVIPTKVSNKDELLAFEKQCLDAGYEGIMIRTGNSPYKCGRSSLKEAYLLKIKRFKDSEAEIIGFEELLNNHNKASTDELGKTKRSKHKANLIPAGTLGKFLVKEVGGTPWNGKEFAIGTGNGLTHELRKEIWDNKSAYLGKLITYKYQVHGIKDLPRLPIWKGFRNPIDT